MTTSGPGAFASSLRDSADDLAGVPGLEKPPGKAVDDRLIMVPIRDLMDFVEGEGEAWSGFDMNEWRGNVNVGSDTGGWEASRESSLGKGFYRTSNAPRDSEAA